MSANNVTRMLDAKNIPYRVFKIPEEKLSALEVVDFLKLPADEVYKTILAKRSKGGKPILAIVPGALKVDVKKLAAALNEKKVFIPTQREAEEMTGLLTGGISPLALIHQGFQVLLDVSAQTKDSVVISAGQRGLQVRVGVNDLVRLTNAHWGDITG